MALVQLLSEILRRAIDGSINPANISVTVNITNGDIKVVTAGYGLVVPNRSGTQYYRILMEDNGAISADPL